MTTSPPSSSVKKDSVCFLLLFTLTFVTTVKPHFFKYDKNGTNMYFIFTTGPPNTVVIFVI